MNANAGRGEWFRATMAKPATITTMVVGASIALLRGRARGRLRGAAAAPAAVESTGFCDAYDLQVAREQDDGRLRELFDPKTIVWLSEHPMRPHIELRAGYLVVYVPGFIEDLGRVIWLLESAERIAERVQSEVGEVVG